LIVHGIPVRKRNSTSVTTAEMKSDRNKRGSEEEYSSPRGNQGRECCRGRKENFPTFFIRKSDRGKRTTAYGPASKGGEGKGGRKKKKGPPRRVRHEGSLGDKNWRPMDKKESITQKRGDLRKWRSTSKARKAEISNSSESSSDSHRRGYRSAACFQKG